MRHPLILFLLMLTTSAANGQPAPGRAEVKQVLWEALSLQAPEPASLPRLPESANEPVRAVPPAQKRAPVPAPRFSREILERAGRMATQLPTSVSGEPTRMGAAMAGEAADSRAAAGREQAEMVRQQRPPRPGTPGSRPEVTPPPTSPPIPPVDAPHTPTPSPPSGTPGPKGP